MQIKSTAFGTLEINPDEVLTFPQGLPGFEDCKRFKLFHEEKETPVVHWLQSLDRPDVTFSVIDPVLFGLNYDITLNDAEAALLGADNIADIAVMLIAYKPQANVVAQASINANINGPIILNTRTRVGMQKVLVVVDAGVTLRNRE